MPTGDSLTLTLESFDVQPGTERQVCKVVNLPVDVPFDIVRFQSTMQGTSHHFNAYKVLTNPLEPVTPDETEVHDCQPGADQLNGDAAYIFGSATPERAVDMPARLGGEEFAVLMPGTPLPEAAHAAERLRGALQATPIVLRDGQQIHITVSIGLTQWNADDSDIEATLKRADAALYRCKRNGRGTVEVFDADRDQLAEEGGVHGGVTLIRDVIRARKLTPVYQPIVDLRNGNVLGFEGLVRPMPGSPFSNPGQLFSAAAAAGRTVELDLACFEVVAAGSVVDAPATALTGGGILGDGVARVLTLVATAMVLAFAMLVRGLLFLELTESGRRARAFRKASGS